MNLKENLYSYMKGCPRSFVGFFDLVSELLGDLGADWLEHANETENPKFKEWGTVFIETSHSVKNVSEALNGIYMEYEQYQAERAEPANLIEDFKNKVMGIKNGNK